MKMLLTGLLLLLQRTHGLGMTKIAAEDSDRLSRWQDRWQNNNLGWHAEDVHEALQKYGTQFIPGLGDNVCSNPIRVFVPLCGKTVDMAFLASQSAVSHVVGVDGIRQALETFGSEHPELEIKPAESYPLHERLEGKKISLLKGDFFQLDDSITGGRFEAILDRASMVAIDPSLREVYVDTIHKLLAPGGKIMLIVIERNTGTNEDKNGPPFSLPETEVELLYDKDWVESITLLDDDGEKERNKDTSWRSLYFLVQAK